MRNGLLALVAFALMAPAAGAACLDTPEVARLGAAIIERRRVPDLPRGLSLADARCTQQKLVALLAQPWGDTVGYKVGLTNRVAQERFGVPHPLRGAIFHGTLRARSGAELPAGFGVVPVVEADLLVRVRDDAINSAGSDHLAILRSLDQVIPFIELPDLVVQQGQPMDGGILQAINVGARLGVMGEPIAVEASEAFARRLGTMEVVLLDDRRELARAPGSALLGHPLNVIPWLVQDLAAEGRRLRAGEYVSLGGFSPTLPVETGRTYTSRYEGLLERPVTVSVRMQ
jgi:2-keto-4-pentenoate hydratase